jgi:peptidoglycan/xylan/chitin deacetylase (PgdA/CDA1 family)
MYHHINSDDLPLSNSLVMMEAHLSLIARRYTTVFPGENVPNGICLTFDDGYFDFYHYVFPLLQKYHLKALLAVPTAYIMESTTLSAPQRLSLTHAQIYENAFSHAPFCTYEELREMVSSGYVRIASHSTNHLNLTDEGIDLEEELITSKALLEEKLGVKIDSFVLPYGKYNASVITLAKHHYPYVFRIGNAFNPSWEGIGGMIYRIKGDALKTPNELFSPLKQLGFWAKTLIKKVSN